MHIIWKSVINFKIWNYLLHIYAKSGATLEKLIKRKKTPKTNNNEQKTNNNEQWLTRKPCGNKNKFNI